MIKISKKSIILSLVILAVLALGSLIFMADTAAAEGGRNVIFGRTGNDFYAPRVTASASDGVNTVVSYSYPVPSTATPPARTASTTRVETESPLEQNDDVSDLAANAVFGESSFMPSGIIQWILFLIFILIIVLLVRRFWGYEREYMLTPLKHN